MKQIQRNIVMNMNSKYFPYSLVMLQSLFDNNVEISFCIYLLYSDIKQWELDYLDEFIYGFQGEFIPVEVDNKVFQDFPLNPRWSIETYYRLLISELLPEEVSQVLYLDIDLIVDGNISDLFNIEMDSYYLAACVDLYEKIDYQSLNQKWRRSENVKYFNAGVMLLNLRKIRENVCFDDYINVIQIMQGELPYMDQDILNYLFGEKVQYLQMEYNYVIGLQTAERRRGIIYHYGTPEKPWNTEKGLACKDLWWKYANRVIDYKKILEKVVKER